MLHELLKIKNIREQAASDEVRKCRNRLEVAIAEVEKKQEELKSYIDWRCKEEQSLYDNIINKEVRQSALDQLKQKVAVMREKDVSMEEAVSEAKKRVVDEEKALEVAREAHMKAMQAVQKFEEFTKVLDEEATKEVARIEDLEMEEFTVKYKE